MRQEVKNTELREMRILPEMSNAAAYRWRAHIRAYLPSDVAKIYNQNDNQENFSEFELQLIPRVKRIKSWKNISHRDAVLLAYDDWSRDRAHLAQSLWDEKATLEGQLKVQQEELRQLRSEIEKLRQARQGEAKATSELLDGIRQVLVDGFASMEARIAEVEKNASVVEEKHYQKLVKFEEMQYEMGRVFNAISEELQKRDVL